MEYIVGFMGLLRIAAIVLIILVCIKYLRKK